MVHPKSTLTMESKFTEEEDRDADLMMERYLTSQNTPIQDIRDRSRGQWHRGGMSHNKEIAMDIIHRDLDSPDYMPGTISGWDWNYLSLSLPIGVIMDSPRLPWRRRFLSRNEGITSDLVSRDKEANGTLLPNAIGDWE